MLFRSASDGTDPVTHTYDDNINAVTWSSNDVIAYGGREFTRIFSWRHATSSDSPSPVHVQLQEGEYYECDLLSFSPDGAWLAACSYRHLYVYDVQTRACLREIPLDTLYPTDLSFSSDGTTMYTDTDTFDVSDLRELPPSSDAGAVSHQLVGQRRKYVFDPDRRWIVGQDGRRACRFPPLNNPRMRSHGEKVAVWDETGRFLLLRME